MNRHWRIGLFVFLCIGVLAWWHFHPGSGYETAVPNKPAAKISPTNIPTKERRDDHAITVNETTFRYRFSVIRPVQSIRLIPNFAKQQGTETIVNTASCSAAINAGYYTPSHEPLGMWDDGMTRLGNPTANPLINSYVWKSKEGKLAISDSAPKQYSFAFQTGPQLVDGGVEHRLTINNDEPARRSVFAITETGLTVFLSVYGETSVLTGPTLSQLPHIVAAISNKENFGVRDATNLDGGSASFFWDRDSGFLDELTAVGSVICALGS